MKKQTKQKPWVLPNQYVKSRVNDIGGYTVTRDECTTHCTTTQTDAMGKLTCTFSCKVTASPNMLVLT